MENFLRGVVTTLLAVGCVFGAYTLFGKSDNPVWTTCVTKGLSHGESAPTVPHYYHDPRDIDPGIYDNQIPTILPDAGFGDQSQQSDAWCATETPIPDGYSCQIVPIPKDKRVQSDPGNWSVCSLGDSRCGVNLLSIPPENNLFTPKDNGWHEIKYPDDYPSSKPLKNNKPGIILHPGESIQIDVPLSPPQ